MMTEEQRAAFKDQTLECSYSDDWRYLAKAVWEAGDGEWAKTLYARAIKSARSVEDKAMLLFESHGTDLCPEADAQMLVAYLEQRKNRWHNIEAARTFYYIDLFDKGNEALAKATHRCRTMDVLIDASKLAAATWGGRNPKWAIELLEQAESRARSGDDWHFMAEAWVTHGLGKRATIAADHKDRLMPDAEDIQESARIIAKAAPDAARTRLMNIIDALTDPFDLSRAIVQLLNLGTEEEAVTHINRMVNSGAVAMDILPVINALDTEAHQPMISGLLRIALSRCEDVFDQCSVAERYIQCGFIDKGLAVFEMTMDRVSSLSDQIYVASQALCFPDQRLIKWSEEQLEVIPRVGLNEELQEDLDNGLKLLAKAKAQLESNP